MLPFIISFFSVMLGVILNSRDLMIINIFLSSQQPYKESETSRDHRSCARVHIISYWQIPQSKPLFHEAPVKC